MSRPTHTLKHEHRVIEQGLRALEGICVRLELGSQVPVEALIEILDFVQMYADRFHHEKEESILFPALHKKGMQVEGGPLGFLHQEHQTERKLLIDLGVAVSDLRHGNNEAKSRIIELARNYCRHLQSHMRREDAILFALAEEILDESTKKELNDAFSQIQHDFGEKSVEDYERMVSELETAWAV